MASESAVPSEKKPSVQNNPSVSSADNENKDSTTLLWFSPNIGSCQDTERTKRQLRRINDNVIFHPDPKQCITCIKSIGKEKIF
ncbi:unnamed protein product [Rotaria sp. Silwood1]|nr:unnamed protein product [Rotaria sp. Silwood1]